MDGRETTLMHLAQLIAGRRQRHPDLYTAEEAAEYLGLHGARSLETLRKHGVKLQGLPYRQGGGLLYHREDLDAAARQMFGKDTPQGEREKAR